VLVIFLWCEFLYESIESLDKGNQKGVGSICLKNPCEESVYIYSVDV